MSSLPLFYSHAPRQSLRRYGLLALPILAGLLLPGAARSETFTPAQRAEIVTILRQALVKDPTILKDAITALQQDENSRALSAREGAIAANASRLTSDPADPVAGNPKGSTSIVEFYDVRCPYCRRMVPVMDELIRKHPELRVVYKDMPILGAKSELGSRALLAAQKQGGYVQLRAALMHGSPDLTQEDIDRQARTLGLDVDRLHKDMQDPAIEKRLADNIALGRSLGLEGTPAYVIGSKLFPGAVDLPTLENAIAPAAR
ncbi:DsbA family protein [Granulibacter bethesdensis]|uniref:DsbA family protein n=1 Tax=Granulibacter bethesdensis TaxID=364410 RepID=UPI00090B9418|nr:DsbA family protein [Granulibacter bethesdensis]APH58684.1 Outer membrane protein [Granulibacter bethesdensis]